MAKTFFSPLPTARSVCRRATLRSQTVEEEQQSVGDVDGRHAWVEVERHIVELRIHFFQFLFYALRHHMVGDTSEGLQAHHIVDPLSHHADDIAGQKPSLAKLRGQRHHAIHLTGFVEDVGKRTEIAEARS